MRRGEMADGFDAFLDEHLVTLTRYAAVLTGDRDRAHDTLADALISAHRRWARIAVMEHPLAYVRRIVTTTYLSERRRWGARTIRLVAVVPEVPAPDPTAAVDDRAQLGALLIDLPRQQRAAVVLRFYLDCDTAEIAAELGVTAGAARTAISRGLRALRIAIDDQTAIGDLPAAFGAPNLEGGSEIDDAPAPGTAGTADTPPTMSVEETR